jgi:hypothetical protein
MKKIYLLLVYLQFQANSSQAQEIGLNCNNFFPYLFNISTNQGSTSRSNSFYNAVCRNSNLKSSISANFGSFTGDGNWGTAYSECNTSTSSEQYTQRHSSVINEISTSVYNAWKECTYSPDRPGLYATIFQSDDMARMTLHIVYTPLSPSDNEPIQLAAGDQGFTLSADFSGYSVVPPWHDPLIPQERIVLPRSGKNIYITIPSDKREGRVTIRLKFHKVGNPSAEIPITGKPLGLIERPELKL